MNNLEKYLDQVIEQRPVAYEAPLEESSSDAEGKPNFLKSAAKRWYVVLLVTVLLSALGLPAIWLLLEPLYVVQGTVRVAPAVESILTGEMRGSSGPGYRDFVNTQAKILTSGPVLQRIADELQDRNLSIFSGMPQSPIEHLIARVAPRNGSVDPAVVLKKAVADKTIAAGHISQTELVAVTMRGRDADEAKQIVDAFITQYQDMYGRDSLVEEDKTLRVLEDQRDQLTARMEDQRNKIRNLAEEYGTTVLDSRQDMELRRYTVLQAELTRLEAQRIALEANIGLLEQSEEASITPDQLVAARKEYVNTDPMIMELSSSVVQMERDLLVARQSHKPGHPALIKMEQTLVKFQESLEAKRQELEAEFDASMEDRVKVAAEQRLAGAQAQIEQLKAHEARLRDVLNNQDLTTRQVGQTNLDIQDVQFRLDLDLEYYDQLSRRIKTMEMERQQRPRITVASRADVVSTQDRRPKLAAAMVFGAMAVGFVIAFMKDRMDKTLQTPDDVTRHLGLPVLGTTTSSRTVKPAEFAERIAGDYQTIRTNLRLLASGGMPQKLTVTSPGMREGKTTFAVNLAISLAKSGKKVLLVDGDLRKPDVRYMLKMSNGTPGVQEVLLGEDPRDAITALAESGLHVLPANSRSLADVYELLVSSTAADQVDRLSRDYDHVIIDTPPALAFPDALVWAKLTDAVVLVGFAGQTTVPDLKEAKERFGSIRARVVGAVLSNVPAEQSLYRYGQGYDYRPRGSGSVSPGGRQKKLLLSTPEAQDTDA
jgi:capsular exopolysaccharide synthesis family protein